MILIQDIAINVETVRRIIKAWQIATTVCRLLGLFVCGIDPDHLYVFLSV
jgi:hypothetical protein